MLQVATGSSIVPVNDGTGLITALHYVDYPLSTPAFLFSPSRFPPPPATAPSSPLFLIPPASVIPVSLPLAGPFQSPFVSSRPRRSLALGTFMILSLRLPLKRLLLPGQPGKRFSKTRRRRIPVRLLARH